MPALYAFGRRWQISSDDFVFPGLTDLLMRVSWLTAACIIYWKHDTSLSCPGGHYMRVYLYGNFVVLLSLIFADVALIQNSMASYIMDQEARKYVRPCVYLRLVFEIPEIGWNILGTVWIFTKTASCADAPEAVIYMHVLIWFNWALCVLMIITVALVFDPLGSTSKKFDEFDYEKFEAGSRYNRSTRLWERRCKVLMCSCMGNDDMSRDAFKEMGRIMSILFEDMDLVPSDLAAGLIILNMKSQYESLRGGSIDHERETSGTLEVRELENYKQFLKFNPSVSIAVRPNVWNSPHRISHYMRFALGSYGWPWYLVANPRVGLCKLWNGLVCCGSCGLVNIYSNRPATLIQGDNCCYCNLSAMKDTIKVEEKDLIYVSFQNNVFQTPFYVAVDHSTSSIVIAIRGTMSLRDTMTDLTAEAKPLNTPGLPAECKAHYGMILTAKNVLEKIQTLKILDKTSTLYPEYTLVLTGHSLGGGTAAILAIMMKHEYPNLRCYAYSPPGGLLTLEGSEYCNDFITSVVLGDDIVCRLSVPSFEKFKNQLQTTIKKCRIPKYRILMGGCWYLLIGRVPKHLVVDDAEQDDLLERRSDTQLLSGVSEPNYHTYVSLAEESYRLQREAVTKCPMYPPGKIFHVTERSIFQSRPDLVDGPRFEWRWADREEFNEIKVTPNMWIHHYPDTVYRALLDVATSEPELQAIYG